MVQAARSAMPFRRQESAGMGGRIRRNFHPVIVTAVLDRLLHHSTVVNIRGNSYRLMGKTAHELLEGDQNTEESGSVFTTENGSVLKDR